jgi:hypothetical protein
MPLENSSAAARSIVKFQNCILALSFPEVLDDRDPLGRASLVLSLNETGTLTVNDEDGAGYRNGVTTDPSDPEAIRRFLQAWKQHVASCWTYKIVIFNFPPSSQMRPTRRITFSTRQLAEDWGRFRKATKADKVSLYGGNYGTTVMSTNATTSPELVL